MGKYTYEQVYEIFKKNGCTMLTENYVNLTQDIDFIGSCGHYCRNNLSKLLMKQCFNCCMCDKRALRGNIIQGKTYLKMKRKMERLYKMTHKYRSDFTPENYNKTLTCWDCTETKPMRLFPYRKQYKDNKEKRCKQCNNDDSKKRKYTLTDEQYVNKILTLTKHNAKKRFNQGREKCGDHNISVSDIFEIYNKQHGLCALSNRKLEFKVLDENSLSIDRIDSNKGYTKDNVQLTTFLANQCKSNMTDEKLFELCRDIYYSLKDKFENNTENPCNKYEDLKTYKKEFVKKQENKKIKQNIRKKKLEEIKLKEINESKCEDCNKNISIDATRCVPCANRHTFKINKLGRPSYSQLMKDKEELKTFVAIGKKYGKSDNSIRKWIKTYEKYELFD